MKIYLNILPYPGTNHYFCFTAMLLTNKKHKHFTKDLHGNLSGLLAVLFWHAQETVLGENNHKVVLPLFPKSFQFDRKGIDESYMRRSVY